MVYVALQVLLCPLTIRDHPVALIGSHLDNNDEIIDSPNKSVYICIYHDQPKPLGFLSNI